MTADEYRITIDPEFQALIPPLTPTEYEELEASCLAEGIRDPITTWNGVLVDGHNRYRIAQENNLLYEIRDLLFADRDEAMCWIITNQLARRNLPPIDCVRLLERRRGMLEKQAKARMLAGVNNPPPNLEEGTRGEVTHQLAREAGVSHNTYEALATVVDSGVPELQKAVREKKVGASTAAQVAVMPPEKQREITALPTKKAIVAAVKEEQQKPKPEDAESAKKFNLTNDNIGWAAWSWNPVTGCLYGCPYCYARRNAMRFYGHFKPEFHADRLEAPTNTKPKSSPGGNRVFVGSSCDLFGDWVPNDWILDVIRQAEKHPEWTFLFLTKNPKRYPDFKFSSNCWLGATADRQERVADIEEAFAKVRAGGTFVSCEPLLEPVHFNRPDLIDWYLIGALSEGAKKVQPNWKWIYDLIVQAEAAGKPWWLKDNVYTQQSPFKNSAEQVQEEDYNE